MTINCNEREEWLEGDWQSWVLGQISRNCRSSLWSVQILTRPGPSFLAPYSSTQTLSIWSRPIFTTLPCTSYRTWRHWSHSSQTPSWDERRLTAWQDDSSEDVVTRRRSSKEKYLWGWGWCWPSLLPPLSSRQAPPALSPRTAWPGNSTSRTWTCPADGWWQVKISSENISGLRGWLRDLWLYDRCSVRGDSVSQRGWARGQAESNVSISLDWLHSM